MRALGLALIMTGFASAATAQVAPKADGAIRFATFNASLNAREAGGIVRRLETRVDAQARKIAEVIQRVRPDVLLLQELDRDLELRSLELIGEYLARGENGAEGIAYPFAVFPPSNTGVPSGVDLDGDGKVTLPNDAKGFGFHAGQYAFALLSRLPLREATTYGNLLWRDLPGSQLPPGHYSEAALAVLPLSSKTHLVATVETSARPIRIYAAHPTPPVFDDPASDFNGRRNADEIRLLLDLLVDVGPLYPHDAQDLGRDAPRSGLTASGNPAGLPVLPDAMAGVVMGDLNADSVRGDARPGAIAQLLDHPAINPVIPGSSRGDITADFNGGMRVDYVLPTRDLEVTGSGVFWPADGDPLARLNDASDHHLVWVDVRVRSE